jgi:hypothetical protein
MSNRRLPALSSEWNSQFAHAFPKSIGVKPQDLSGPSRSVDLSAGHLQGLPDMPGIDFVQRRQGSISAHVRNRLATSGNRPGQKRFK